jgi:hypothetical protein
LSFDGSRFDGVLVRRTNGSVEVKKSFTASLSLDPLTAEVELAGREIRNQLDAGQIRERWCAVCLPVNWALTLTVKLPEIPEEDVADFLHCERRAVRDARRYSARSRRAARSRVAGGATPAGDVFAWLDGVATRRHGGGRRRDRAAAG